MTTPRSLYIHVPFCVRRCSYCDFAVDVRRDPPVDEWLDAISRELTLTAADRTWPAPLDLDTLYIGGGTPSLLGTGVMSRLLAILEPFAVLDSRAEWTCEANPESLSPQLAKDWREAGVNRISLGVQTFHQATLRWMARLHGAEGARTAVATARAAGFDNLSIDLIFGVPGELGRNWRADLDQAIDLAPEHISLYGLTAEPAAPLGRWVSEGKVALADEDHYAAEYLLAHEVLTAAGYEHYEVSNFARGGMISRHNHAYWDGDPYLALGPGAHGFAPPLREWNLRSWTAYRDSLLAGRRPVESSEMLDEGASALERVWLGLRTRGGYRLLDPTEAQSKLLRAWVQAGLAVQEGDGVRLTAQGWLLLDRLAVDLHDAGATAVTERPRRRAIDDARPLVQIAANSNPNR